MSGLPSTLRGVSDLREFFRTNQTPIYFVSPTPFNLLGIDRWVRNFHYVSYFDSFEGSHPNVFVPREREPREFRSIEEICNYLLSHSEVLDLVKTHGTGGRCAFVMFDAETEALAAYADLPLFLFHLLEYLDVDYEIDVDEINERWSREAAVDVWSQIIVKETGDEVELLTHAPHTGIYQLGKDGAVNFRRWGNDWHGIVNESEAFYLRIHSPGDYRYRGADLGALVTRGRLQTDDNELGERCKQWAAGIRSQFAGTPLTPQDPPPVGPLAFKMA